MITDKDQFLNITREALERRSTSTTLKNDTSSRSHAVCRIRFENTEVKAAEDGFLYLIDLAGSENASDSQFHDKTRIQETKDINKSLMCLKDCIRNRSKAAVDPTTFVHIPYRQSKLSLLLKDAFELESFIQSKTVVIANIAPSAADMAMTLNTLRYVAPIKQGMKNRSKVEPDRRNPVNWDNEELSHWVTNKSKGKVDPKVLCPWETGRQILSITEADFLSRIISKKMGEKAAKEFYLSLWKLFIDSRNRDRKAKMRPLKSHLPNARVKKQESEPALKQDENPANIGKDKTEVGKEQQVSIKFYTKENIF